MHKYFFTGECPDVMECLEDNYWMLILFYLQDKNFHNFTNFEDISKNKIVNFPQLQCLAETFRSNLVKI